MAENTKNVVTENEEQNTNNEAPNNMEIVAKQPGFLEGLLANPVVVTIGKALKIALFVGAAATGLTIAEKIGEEIGEKKARKKEKDGLDEVMDIVETDDEPKEVTEE